MILRNRMFVITWNQFARLPFRGGFYRTGAGLCCNVLVPYGEDNAADTMWVAVIK